MIIVMAVNIIRYLVPSPALPVVKSRLSSFLYPRRNRESDYLSIQGCGGSPAKPCLPGKITSWSFGAARQ